MSNNADFTIATADALILAKANELIERNKNDFIKAEALKQLEAQKAVLGEAAVENAANGAAVDESNVTDTAHPTEAAGLVDAKGKGKVIEEPNATDAAHPIKTEAVEKKGKRVFSDAVRESLGASVELC